MALLLKSRGISQIRPLLGGLDGWSRLDYPLETVADPAAAAFAAQSVPAIERSDAAASHSTAAP